MNIEKLKIKHVDSSLVGLRFGKLTIIEPYKYYRIDTSNDRNCHVKCVCDCGSIIYPKLKSLTTGHTKKCTHCTDNKFYILNDYVTIMEIYNSITNLYEPVLINTNCVNYIKMICNKYTISKSSNRFNIIGHASNTQFLLYRLIVNYINSQYNLPQLSREFDVDHISGNTFNNLYYPLDDEISRYYNNLRMCTRSQNNLNRYCLGYNYRPKHSIHFPYRSYIRISGKDFYGQFSSPQECINYNNQLILSLSPEDAKFYYHSPTNPRNDPTTFSNTILNAIGYNDTLDYEITDTDFDDE